MRCLLPVVPVGAALLRFFVDEKISCAFLSGSVGGSSASCGQQHKFRDVADVAHVHVAALVCKEDQEGQLLLIWSTCLKELFLQAQGHVCHHGIYHSGVLQVPRLFVAIFGFEIQRCAKRPCCVVQVGSSVCCGINMARSSTAV